LATRTQTSHTYSAIIASIMVLLGLPMTVGVLFVANTRGADIDPDPEPSQTVLICVAKDTYLGRWYRP
jgi:hypothetical protein